MSFHAQFDRLSAFLLNLECLDMAGQCDAFMNEVMECGGSYVPPAGDDWSSHLFEISLHGVVAYGSSEDEAIRNWKKAARAQVSLVEDGAPYPTPGHIAVMDCGARVEVWEDEGCSEGCFCGQLLRSGPPHVNDVSCMWDTARIAKLVSLHEADFPLPTPRNHTEDIDDTQAATGTGES